MALRRLGTGRGLVTFLVGLGVGASAYAGVSAGVLPDAARLPVAELGPLVRPAAAGELPAFDSCEQLRRWYVRTTLPGVGPWGLAGPPVMTALGRAESSDPAAGAPSDAVGSTSTGTNVQEQDVDEADVVKTDGRLVVRVSGGDLVVTDVSGEEPRELSRAALPGRALSQPELLLHDGHVVVVGDEAQPRYERGPGGGPIFDREGIEDSPGATPVDPTRLLPVPAPADDRLRVVAFDLSDPATPRVTDDRSIDGGIVAARLYADGTVRLTVTTGAPPLDFVSPNRDRSPRQATRLNRELVRKAPITAWLPAVRTGGGTRRPLLDCSQVHHPRHASGSGTLSVVAFPAGDPTRFDATAVTTSGDLAYSSADRIYVGTTNQGRTTVHAFEVAGRRTRYVASGELPGTVKDRWSFDEHDGRLRVVTSVGGGTNPQDNVLEVLAERGGRLERTGSVAGLGRGEQVTAVRWFGDLAVVVTFRQTDPLHTVDLSDPDRPRLVGTLHVPGFSTYLHPVGDGRLVGIGRDATSDGTDLGAQASTFDLHDLTDVRRTDTLPLGAHADVPAGTDPRLFTYLPSKRVLVTPVQSWDTGATELVALRVDRDGGLSEVASWDADASGGAPRTLPLDDGRLALVGGDVRVVDVP